MPREGPSDTARKIMGRHQACHRCRRRKLKCDGGNPCSPCQRAHAYEVRVRPSAAPAEPSCVYDHPDLVAEGPKGLIGHLESEIAKLRELLEAANARLERCTCGAAASAPTNIPRPGAPSALMIGRSQHSSSSATSQLALEHSHVAPDLRHDGVMASNRVPNLALSSPSSGAFSTPNNLRNIGGLPTPSILTFDSSSFLADGIGTVTFDLFPSAWPPNLPPPAVLYHLVETFFASVPLASRLIHKPTFMVALQQLPTSLDFPHLALLHAICGLASLYSPIIADPKLDKTRTNALDGLFGPDIHGPLDPADDEQVKHRFPKTLYDLKGAWDKGFGVAHIRLASMSLRLSMGDRKSVV